jgi:antitoxin ChpS
MRNASRLDETTRSALQDLKERLLRRYGTHLRGVVLFGSRARGDARPDSDADVAVFLDEVPDPIAAQLDIIDEGYPILLATGINIQPWVFEEASLHEPEKHRASHLLCAVQREGVHV